MGKVMAWDCYWSVHDKAAFNIQGNLVTETKKLNQHGTDYTFKDGSKLCIRGTTRQAMVYSPNKAFMYRGDIFRYTSPRLSTT